MIERYNIYHPEVNIDDAKLSIIFENNAVAFAVTNAENELIHSKKWTDCSENEFVALIKDETDLIGSFQKINIAFHNTLVATLPDIENVSEAESVLFLNGGKQHDHLMLDILKNDTAIGYQISYELLTNIAYHFQGANYWHLHSVWTNQLTKNLEGDTVLIYLEQQIFSIAVWKNKQLLLCTSYNYHSLSEVLFYVLKATEIYQLSQTATQIKICGYDNENNLFKNLSEYFEQVAYYSCVWNTLSAPSHQLTPLYFLSICE